MAETLKLLWEGHRAAHSNSYGYRRFCELYRAWEAKLTPAMRQTHIAGERMFVDYAGTTIDIFDAAAGQTGTCQAFVAVPGASSYAYAEAARSQGLADWIGSHTRAFAFFGGAPGTVVTGDLKSAVTDCYFSYSTKATVMPPCATSFPVIHVSSYMVCFAKPSPRSAFVATRDVTRSFRSSVMCSACVRVKPPASSFLITLCVSIV